MPEIVSYHAEFDVEGTEDTIQADLDDWYDSGTVLNKLGRAFGCRTVGSLIKKLRNQVHRRRVAGLLNVRLTSSTRSGEPVKSSDEL